MATNSLPKISIVDFFFENHCTKALFTYIKKLRLYLQDTLSSTWSLSTNMWMSTSLSLGSRAFTSTASLAFQWNSEQSHLLKSLWYTSGCDGSYTNLELHLWPNNNDNLAIMSFLPSFIIHQRTPIIVWKYDATSDSNSGLTCNFRS